MIDILRGPPEMTLDRWQQVSQIYHAALAREGSERAAFLTDACASDETLRREVESLLAHEHTAEGVLAAPALNVAAQVLPENAVPERIGRYRVTGKLGEGGMGVVYRAYDEKLQRNVAIKLLGSVSDETGRKRILQEARAASALNHPNICTVYEVDDEGDQTFIVMEHIEGKPLSNLMPPVGLFS